MMLEGIIVLCLFFVPFLFGPEYSNSPSKYARSYLLFFQCFISNVKKVKCTPVQALRLCTGRSRGIALLFLDHGSRKG